MEGIKMNKVKEERVTDLSIIMDMIAGKTPYYSIRYKNVGEDDYNIGYSSFNLKTVLEFIDEYFEIVESDRQTNADRIRNMSDEELADWLHNMCDFEKDEEPYKSIYNLDTEKEEEIHDSYGDLLNWLQSEAQ
jgi:hypothetical protein